MVVAGTCLETRGPTRGDYSAGETGPGERAKDVVHRLHRYGIQSFTDSRGNLVDIQVRSALDQDVEYGKPGAGNTKSSCPQHLLAVHPLIAS